jgi:hypothetical protein
LISEGNGIDRKEVENKYEKGTMFDNEALLQHWIFI